MIPAFFRLLILLLFSITLSSCQPENTQNQNKAKPGDLISWQKDFQTTLQVAARENKNIMVDFRADWCQRCLKYEEITFQNENLARIVNSSLVSFKHDMTKITSNPKDLHRKYKIEEVPSIIFLSPDGKEIKSAKVSGFLDPEGFIMHLNNNKLNVYAGES